MAVFDMYMSMCVHVRSRFTAPLISGFEVLEQKQKPIFRIDFFYVVAWVRYLAREN
jgi:hypothetical protein